MPEKASSRGSGAKKGAQKYQNAFAYTHNRGSKTTKKILALPVDGLCKRCTDQILWRKQYRKYKPLTMTKKCVSCEQKKITKAYHVLCDGCASEKGVCAKCMETEEIVEVANQKTSQQRLKEQQELEQKLASMRERQRRSYLRKLQRGDIVAADVPDVCKSDDEFDYTDSEEESGSEDEEESEDEE
ncbi:hypothetical protein GGI04_000888 [Coemansia thaxteri]|uniref:Uncharacterized protein n=1 Tax=Coemansia thaxteri TaxID=2663907 RepID=A0A9W8BLM3_9FUNG|nr:hypothetical protein H4R26_001500 [Coemansia thaxteri]KAJ2008887.1 hypothetical protein GGI04_000888 [Coemansia thaxteri]KAJ2473746.1 hypothetical protein GGI02_000618 [Coemansia sp. RSA 2322]KAJ2487235.1 hypothetical protein EV174_000642 [Coemansia sp. RSA 2320]